MTLPRRVDPNFYIDIVTENGRHRWVVYLNEQPMFVSIDQYDCILTTRNEGLRNNIKVKHQFISPMRLRYADRSTKRKEYQFSTLEDSAIKKRALTIMPVTTKAKVTRTTQAPMHIFRIACRTGWRCCYCGIDINDKTATLEHIVAKVNGGKNTDDNLEISCAACNNEKGKFPADLYIIYRLRSGLPVREGAVEQFKYKST